MSQLNVSVIRNLDGTGGPTMGSLNVTNDAVVGGSLTATAFVGDGSRLTGVTAVGTGVSVFDSGSIIGVASAINFGANLSVTAISAGVVTVTNTIFSGITTAMVAGLHTVGSTGDYNDLINTPTNVSSFSNDAGYITGVSTFSGDYNHLINTPTNVSSFTNDSGYVTSSIVVGYATETYVDTAVANLVDSAPLTLDTLNELAQALGDDPNFATTVTNSLGNKANLSGANFTGVVTATSFYGDGSNLSNIISGVGIQSGGTYVGTGFTTLNFIGAGSTFAVNGTTVDISPSLNLGDLNDVVLTTPSVGEVLKYDGTNWVNDTDETGSGGAGLLQASNITQTSTNATHYIGFANATSGVLATFNINSTKLTFNPSTGNLLVGGTLTTNSDERLKTQITDIVGSLDKVNQLRGVKYVRKDNSKQNYEYGLIAQEVEKIYPELVHTDSEGIKSLAYINLIGILIEAIKEQNEVVKGLTDRISEIEKKLS